MDDRVVQHGGVKWMQEDDGTILYFDEGLGKWDLWDPDEDGPTPPENFLVEPRAPLSSSASTCRPSSSSVSASFW